MARPTQPLVWHQLRFALPLAQDAAVGLVERLLADGSLVRVVLELRACGGQATWAVGSHAGERLVSVVRELVPGCRVSRGFSRRTVDRAVVVSARPVGVGLATERLSAVVRAVLAALAVTAEDEELVVQLQLGRRFAPQALGRVEPQGWLELLGLVSPPSVSGERGRRMRAQVGRHRAAVCLRLGVRAASPLRQLMLRPGLRAMLGQAQPRFGLADLLERRRIVVVNLNQGLLGPGAARLLGTLLISQLWQHLLARQAQPAQRRQIVSVYIDEVQAFLAGLPGSLADALAQARSLGAAFHLAHQYRGQLSTEMMLAVETNTRSKVYFALSATDAAAAARLAPELEAADFQLLAQYQAYATVMHHGHRSGWFSLVTRPAPPAVRDPALLYAASHARYGIPAEQTEAELIALTSGSAPSAVDANEQSSSITKLSDATTTDDVTSGGPGDEAVGELKPGALDESGADGSTSGAESESGHCRPAIGRRRRP